jgi:hypothetical protein
MADIRQKAVATAYDYNQGNIAVLDDNMTRRLVASVALTESRGGNPELTSRQGFVGTFQHGAQALADAGFVDQTKLAAAMAGFKSEWAWANSGGMTQFLENRENWKNGLSLEQFKQSPELQNEAFKRNAERAYERAVSDGVLKEGDKPEKIAGFLKVEHVMGYGHAKAAANGERVFRGPDGTSNYDYFHDITRNRDGLDKHMAEQRQTRQVEPEKTATADLLLVSNPNHPEYARYRHCYDLVRNTSCSVAVTEGERINIAGVVAMGCKERDLTPHVILENKNRELFPTQDPGKPHEKTFKVDPEQAGKFDIAKSTEVINGLPSNSIAVHDNMQRVRTFTA